jgi:hypothetical protein
LVVDVVVEVVVVVVVLVEVVVVVLVVVEKLTRCTNAVTAGASCTPASFFVKTPKYFFHTAGVVGGIVISLVP